MMPWRVPLLAGAVVGLACTTDVCGCPPLAATAAVFGRVQTEAGDPVPQAIVSGYIAREGDCGRRDFEDGGAGSRADGTYTLFLAGIEETEATCVRVRVRAPLGSDLLDAPDTTVTLAIRYQGPFDSTRVDATLRAP